MTATSTQSATLTQADYDLGTKAIKLAMDVMQASLVIATTMSATSLLTGLAIAVATILLSYVARYFIGVAIMSTVSDESIGKLGHFIGSSFGSVRNLFVK